jgi:thymidylate kinase
MLALCNHFFDFLNRQDIRYCHWKSNEHLGEALNGKTDLDVLVHPDDEDAFQAAMSDYDFKGILSQPDKRFPGLEDYLGFDEATGTFIHLHVHYRLVLGQKYIKNHHLPLESLIFDNLIRRQGVNIPQPEIELILLIIRAHLKADMISLAKHAVMDLAGRRYTAFPRDIEDELRALQQRSDPQKFDEFLEESGLPLSSSKCHQFLERTSNDKLRSYHILLGHYSILHRLRRYKRSSGFAVYFTYFRHFVSGLPGVKKLRNPKRKTLIGLGKVFSIVGADGSGKSTLIRDLHKWLSWKLTVSEYYYGIPKSRINALFSLSIRIFRKLGLRSMASFSSDLFWLYVAKYRQSVSEKAAKDIQNGSVVITDRFPLKDFRSMKEPMDNPRIDASRSFLGKNLRAIEEKFYDEIQFPDRILVLQVEIDELRRRKTDIALDKHQLKAAAVNSLASKDPIVVFDANKPYEEVLLEVKKFIWQAL